MPDFLSVTKPGKFFLRGGKPFFWLGDTAWLMFRKLSFSETKMYLENRAQKGFTVIQASLMHEKFTQNPAGSLALVDERFDLPNMDKNPQSFWNQVDETIRYAASLGLVMALLPAWGEFYVNGSLNPETIEPYSDFLARRFGHYPNILWLVGGDVRGDHAYDNFVTMGQALRMKCPNHLIGYHPFGRSSSSMWFHHCDWLDFNMFQSGHRDYSQIKLNQWDDKVDVERWVGEDNYQYVRQDLAMDPKKPTLDGEPSYELIPHGLHDSKKPYWQAHDVRRYAYWSMLSGAAGHTYGDNSIMQFWFGTETAAYGAMLPWQESLHNPGSIQMLHMRRIMEAIRWYEGSACQEFLVHNDGQEYAYNVAFRTQTAVCVYSYSGLPFEVDIGKVPFASGYVYWIDPVVRIASFAGFAEQKGIKMYTPPNKRLGQQDWIFVISRDKLAYPLAVSSQSFCII